MPGAMVGKVTKGPPIGTQNKNGISMDESVQKSCWGVTAKAVIGFACIILVAWLIAGADSGAVVAATS